MRYPQAITHLNLPATDTARLTITAELQNATNHFVKGTLHGRIGAIDFAQQIRLEADESRVAAFTPETFPQLVIPNPKLWWPAQVGPQNLYPLNIRFEMENGVSGEAALQFGIREVTSVVDSQSHRLFQINGKNILIRGAGYSFDMLLRSSPQRQEDELKYVCDMNLNAVRLEGKLDPAAARSPVARQLDEWQR